MTQQIRFFILALAVTAGCVVLTLVADALTLCGGYIVLVGQFDMHPHTFWARVWSALRAGDVLTSVVKAGIFGTIIGSVGCSAGMRSKRATQELGEHTRGAVVASSFLILITNVVLTRFYLWLYP